MDFEALLDVGSRVLGVLYPTMNRLIPLPVPAFSCVIANPPLLELPIRRGTINKPERVDAHRHGSILALETRL